MLIRENPTTIRDEETGAIFTYDKGVLLFEDRGYREEKAGVTAWEIWHRLTLIAKQDEKLEK